jgi:hypothetical protein
MTRFALQFAGYQSGPVARRQAVQLFVDRGEDVLFVFPWSVFNFDIGDIH